MNTLRVTRSGSKALRDERGMALLIAVVLLLLMSALGITALQHAQTEASASGRSRRKDSTLYAGEAGLSMVQQRLLSNWGGATMAAFTIDESALVTDGFNNPIAVRTGRPENSAAESVCGGGAGTGRAEASDGYMMNIGNQGAQSFSACRADVVATDTDDGMVHLQAQYRIHEGAGGGSY
jgi:Tfp pilus assembly protein PilX